MEHRYEQRWKIEKELVVEIVDRADQPPITARLVNLSRSGARVCHTPRRLSPGTAIGVRLPKAPSPGRALVLYVQDEVAGLLWIERPSWVDPQFAALRGA